MNDDVRGRRQWTARRALRLAGASTLAIVVLMMLLGVYVLDLSASPRIFFAYWGIFFILLLCVIVLAVFDALATMGKYRGERTRLHEALKRAQRKDSAS
jgi:biotin transporter BioY